VFNNLVLPESNHRLAGLSSDIARKKPTVNLEPGRWVDAFKGYQFYIGGKDEETDAIRDVNVYVLHEGRRPDLLVAPTGRLHYEDAGTTLYIDLFDGEMHQVPEIETETVYRVTRFPAHTIVIRDAGSPLQRTDRPWRSDREMSVGMLRQSIAEKQQQIAQLRARSGDPCRKLVELRLGLLEPTQRAQYFASHRPPPPGRLSAGSEERLRDTARAENGSIDAYVRQIRALQVEIQKKYSIPVACLVFVLLGAPLAIRSGRSGMTMAIASSISCFTIYYILLTGGEKLADRGRVAPWLAMWAANLVFGALGTFLTWRASTDASALEWGRLVPRRFRRRLRAA
jgi:lipopolysaccharide export system permease protein